MSRAVTYSVHNIYTDDKMHVDY